MSESFKKQKKIDGGGVATPAMAEELLASMTPEAIKTALIDLMCSMPDAWDIVSQEAYNLDECSRSIMVEGLNASTTVEKLKNVFNRHGKIIGCTMSSSGQLVSCKIEFDTVAAARDAAAVPSRTLYGVVVAISLCSPAPTTAAAGLKGFAASTMGASAAVVGPAVQEDEETRKLFVKGLSYGTTSKMLRAAFEEEGNVGIESCECVMDKALNRCKGFGFVVFKTSAQAHRAVENPPTKLDSRTIRVFLSQGRDQQSRDQQGQGQGQGQYPYQGGPGGGPLDYQQQHHHQQQQQFPPYGQGGVYQQQQQRGGPLQSQPQSQSQPQGYPGPAGPAPGFIPQYATSANNPLLHSQSHSSYPPQPGPSPGAGPGAGYQGHPGAGPMSYAPGTSSGPGVSGAGAGMGRPHSAYPGAHPYHPTPGPATVANIGGAQPHLGQSYPGQSPSRGYGNKRKF